MSQQPMTTGHARRTAPPIAYEAYGTGPVVVVVGGAFYDRGAFRELAQALGDARAHRGHLRPPGPGRQRRHQALRRRSARSRTSPPSSSAAGETRLSRLRLRRLLRRRARPGGHRRRRPCRHRVGPRAALPQSRVPRRARTLHRHARALEANGDREGILRYFHNVVVGLPEEMLDGMRARRCGSHARPDLHRQLRRPLHGRQPGPAAERAARQHRGPSSPSAAPARPCPSFRQLPERWPTACPRASTRSSRANSTRSPRRPSRRSSPTSSVEQPAEHPPRHPRESPCSARKPSGIRHHPRSANAGLCSGGTTSRGGPGGARHRRATRPVPPGRAPTPIRTDPALRGSPRSG